MKASREGAERRGILWPGSAFRRVKTCRCKEERVTNIGGEGGPSKKRGKEKVGGNWSRHPGLDYYKSCTHESREGGMTL